MLQHVVVTPSALQAGMGHNPLRTLMRTVQHSMVELNTQDVYMLCATASTPPDALGLMKDPEFMRGLHSAFERGDQSLLSPFQISMVNETFKKCGLHVMPKEVVVPEEEEISPESLLNVLYHMVTTKTRNDRRMKQVIYKMVPLLPEFSPMQLGLTAKYLHQLQSTEGNFLAKVARRSLEIQDDLSIMDLTAVAVSCVFIQQTPAMVTNQILECLERRNMEMKQDDVQLLLLALNTRGPKFSRTLGVLVTAALDQVEHLEGELLSQFLTAFVNMEYKDAMHMEIMVDACIEKLDELTDRNVVTVLQSVFTLKLLSPPLFGTIAHRLTIIAPSIDHRNIAAIMDVCSEVEYDSTALMAKLLDRAADQAQMFSPNQLGEILEVVAHYPPARTHRFLPVFAKQVMRRRENIGPPPLRQCVWALSHMGHSDVEFYVETAMVMLRYGMKDYTFLEPFLIGLTSSPVSVDARLIKILTSHVYFFARNMTMPEVERTYGYMTALKSEDERSFRGLADRIRVFVKESETGNLPHELQVLLQRTAAAMAAEAAAAAAEEESGGGRRHYREETSHMPHY